MIRQTIMCLAILSCSPCAAEENPRPRLRNLGFKPGILQPGPLNSITDVPGVLVGHRTLVEGDTVRTGVTAVLPHSGNIFQSKVPAAVFPANAYGKAAGFLQVQELGNLETPIVLTNTLCVGTAVQAVVDWSLRQPGNENVRSVNAVVGETNDGFLNDIRKCAIGPEDVNKAIAAARGGPVDEGSVGAGTGTSLFGWKGGIGTASRVLPESLGGYTIGVLVQTNFGGILTVDGLHVGEALGQYSFKDHVKDQSSVATSEDSQSGGSCMIVLATDAPVPARNLERMAARAALGLARTGSFMHNGSGDFVIAFSTANRIDNHPSEPISSQEVLPNDFMSPLFLATIEGVEEAVLNSLLRATTVLGRLGHSREAFPVEALIAMMEQRITPQNTEDASESPSKDSEQGRNESMSQHDQNLRIDYIELPTLDIESAKSFYSATFGWSFQDWGPEYSSFEDGRLTGGFRKEDQVVRGGPLVVIYALDLEAVVAAVRENGGEIAVEPFAFPGGRRFHFTDPSGNELAVWTDQPEE